MAAYVRNKLYITPNSMQQHFVTNNAFGLRNSVTYYCNNVSQEMATFLFL